MPSAPRGVKTLVRRESALASYAARHPKARLREHGLKTTAPCRAGEYDDGRAGAVCSCGGNGHLAWAGAGVHRGPIHGPSRARGDGFALRGQGEFGLAGGRRRGCRPDLPVPYGLRGPFKNGLPLRQEARGLSRPRYRRYGSPSRRSCETGAPNLGAVAVDARSLSERAREMKWRLSCPR